MTTPPDGFEPVIIDGAKVKALIMFCLMNTKGPQEAYALLMVGIAELAKMNAEQTGEAITNEQLIAEFTTSLSSLELHTALN